MAERKVIVPNTKGLGSRMLYKYPGTSVKIGKGKYEAVVVPEDKAEQCVADGWFYTPWEAKAAYNTYSAERKAALDAKAKAEDMAILENDIRNKVIKEIRAEIQAKAETELREKIRAEILAEMADASEDTAKTESTKTDTKSKDSKK